MKKPTNLCGKRKDSSSKNTDIQLHQWRIQTSSSSTYLLTYLLTFFYPILIDCITVARKSHLGDCTPALCLGGRAAGVRLGPGRRGHGRHSTDRDVLRAARHVGRKTTAAVPPRSCVFQEL